MPDTIVLTLYSRAGCHLCEDMKTSIERVIRETGAAVRVEELDIGTDPALERRYGLEIPVLLVNGRKAAKYRVTEEQLRRLLDR
jgi:hypothetical protein